MMTLKGSMAEAVYLVCGEPGWCLHDLLVVIPPYETFSSKAEKHRRLKDRMLAKGWRKSRTYGWRCPDCVGQAISTHEEPSSSQEEEMQRTMQDEDGEEAE